MSRNYRLIANKILDEYKNKGLDTPPGITIDELAYFLRLGEQTRKLDLSSALSISKSAKEIFDNIEVYRQFENGTAKIAAIGNTILTYAGPVLAVLTGLLVVIYSLYIMFGLPWVSTGGLNAAMVIMGAAWTFYVVAINKMRVIDPSTSI